MKDISFELMDIMLNYRQSGHPGGSHSKTQMLLALMFGGKMRYDIRRPEYRFSDRFILAAGHTIPMVDAVLAMIGDAFRCVSQIRVINGFHRSRKDRIARRFATF